MPPAAAPVRGRDLLRGLASAAGGGALANLEEEIRRFFGSRSVFLVSSGKAALTLILQGLASLRPGRKVLIPAYTCYSVPSAVARAGLDVALCDVDPDTLDFDFSELDRLTDDKTLCVIPTHLFGIPSDVDRVRRICESRGALIVEDAAQAMGVEHHGRKLGTLGDVGFFSLGRGKTITCGSGGIIVTSSPEIGKCLQARYRELSAEPLLGQLRGMVETAFMAAFLNPSRYWLPAGLPFLGIGETKFSTAFPIRRMGNCKAGILGSWKSRMQEYNRTRRSNGSGYAAALSPEGRRKIHSAEVPFLRFPVYAATKQDKAAACDRCRFLGVSPMYPDSLNRIEELRDRFRNLECPGAERVAETLLTLPTHALLTERDRRAICKVLDGLGVERGVDCNVPVHGRPYADSRMGKSGG